MILIGRELLAAYVARQPSAAPRILLWIADVNAGRWTCEVEIRQVYPRIRLLPGRLLVFYFGDAAFNITTQIAFSSGVIVVLGITEGIQQD